jgi:asparagine synthetase B (glutamine-hydrolysing)
MCGISGFVDGRSTQGDQALRAMAMSMADSIQHRGPDAGDTWVDAEAGIAFGHRRLSIVDLSEAGSQPMLSSCGRMLIFRFYRKRGLTLTSLTTTRRLSCNEFVFKNTTNDT